MVHHPISANMITLPWALEGSSFLWKWLTIQVVLPHPNHPSSKNKPLVIS